MNIFNIIIPKNRIYGLDILRATSILMVILEHGNYYMPVWFAEITSYLSYSPITIFFVLSGYLIGRILINQLAKEAFNLKDILKFWKNRWFRTLPAYFLVLFILSIFYWNNESGYSFGVFIKFLTFSQNIAWVHPIGFFGEAWSLSVEEWFYLSTPLLIYAVISILKQKPMHALLMVAVSIVILIPVYRYFRVVSLENYNDQLFDILFRKQVITRLDSLMYGVLAAYFSIKFKKQWMKSSRIKLFGGIVIVIISKFIFDHLNATTAFIKPTFQFCLESIGVLLMLPYLNKVKEGSGLFFKLITIISLTSYSAYLIHRSIIQFAIINNIPFIELFDISITIKSTLSYVLYWMLTLLCSILMYKYFEVPTTKLREKVKF